MKSLAVIALALAVALIAFFWLSKPRTVFAPDAIDVVKAATVKAETAMEAAVVTETKAVASRPKVEAAKEALQEKIEVRIASCINLDDLPAPVLAEFEAMRELVDAMEKQLEFEKQRGDMWRDAALAQQELVSTLQEQQENLTRAANKKGLKWGFVGGVALAILVGVLI
jgi:hypothetical protein